jgi:hypothetical protein
MRGLRFGTLTSERSENGAWAQARLGWAGEKNDFFSIPLEISEKGTEVYHEIRFSGHST